MAVRPFLRWPDKRLRMAADPVAEITDETRAVWADMVDSMEAMPGSGVGLAAVQIGVMQRLAIVDASEARGQTILMANPEVIQASEELRSYPEGSPNLPGVSANIERPSEVTVRFLNPHGESEERELTGLWATSMQHQIDHLNGRMYFDRLSKTKRDMLLRKAKKMAGRG
ncbi:MAG: peptide deformylase [Pseudomonadota bacterium]